jgi:hypothetical protein
MCVDIHCILHVLPLPSPFLAASQTNQTNQPTNQPTNPKQAQALLPSEIKHDAQYSYLADECQRGLVLVQERMGSSSSNTEAAPAAAAAAVASDAEGAVLLETGEGSFGGFVGWRRLVPGWVGGGGRRQQGGSIA